MKPAPPPRSTRGGIDDLVFEVGPVTRDLMAAYGDAVGV